MREILFKAKRLDNGEWVEGFPFPSITGEELNRMTVFEPFPGGTVVNTYKISILRLNILNMLIVIGI